MTCHMSQSTNTSTLASMHELPHESKVNCMLLQHGLHPNKMAYIPAKQKPALRLVRAVLGFDRTSLTLQI